MLDVSSFRPFFMGIAAVALVPGCLTPPCQCGPGAASPEPAGVAPSAAAAPAAASGNGGGGGNGILWDGDENGLGAKGWADCDKKPDCKVTLAADPSSGFNGTAGLKFHGEGPGWIGGGWNLFNWYPEDAGIDVSTYNSFVLRVRVEAKSADEAPEPGSLAISFKSSSAKDKNQSRDMPLVKHTKENLLDGKWHEVVIPTADMKKDQYDPKKVWEMVIATWSATPRNFTVHFDDLRFENR